MQHPVKAIKARRFSREFDELIFKARKTIALV
jgi:hypothetical protein